MSIIVPSDVEKFMNVSGKSIIWRHMSVDSDTKINKDSNGNPIRYFAVALDEEMTQILRDKGWTVIDNEYTNNDGDKIETHCIKIWIRYGTGYPVHIYIANPATKEKVEISEQELDTLHIDRARIQYMDIVIRPYHWTYRNDEGVKAMLQSANIILQPNGLEDDGYTIVNE